MKPSLNTVILLSAVGFLIGIARLMLDVRFVPEVFEMMPEDQPVQTGLIMLFFLVIFAVWLAALLTAAQRRRGGLIALLVCNLLLVFAWGLGTVVSLCPTPCWVVPPLTDLVTWASMLVGMVAVAAAGLYLRGQNA